MKICQCDNKVDIKRGLTERGKGGKRKKQQKDCHFCNLCYLIQVNLSSYQVVFSKRKVTQR